MSGKYVDCNGLKVNSVEYTLTNMGVFKQSDGNYPELMVWGGTNDMPTMTFDVVTINGIRVLAPNNSTGNKCTISINSNSIGHIAPQSAGVLTRVN